MRSPFRKIKFVVFSCKNHSTLDFASNDAGSYLKKAAADLAAAFMLIQLFYYGVTSIT